MHENIYIPRHAEEELFKSLNRDPVTAVIGPRQCGKSTLARKVIAKRLDSLFLDLELPSDLRKLDQAELFLKEHANRLVCIDEIQLRPDLFPLLRALVDIDRRPGRFLILGSASQDLIRQEGETLAGRIHYLQLTPLLFQELMANKSAIPITTHWWRGGFPRALLAENDEDAQSWLRDLIQTFLSRDVPTFGFSIPAVALHRFWKMLAHFHGGVLNASKIGQALDVSHNTVRRYIDLLEQTFMVRVLRPVAVNTKKRLVKAPKVYIRDSGLLHALLEIESLTDLFGHPAYGASWEGWCVEQICRALPDWQPGYYRTASGQEIDLVLEKGRRRLAFECKASLSPELSTGSGAALDVLQPKETYVVAPLREPGYRLAPGVRVCGMRELLDTLGVPGHGGDCGKGIR